MSGTADAGNGGTVAIAVGADNAGQRNSRSGTRLVRMGGKRGAPSIADAPLWGPQPPATGVRMKRIVDDAAWPLRVVGKIAVVSAVARERRRGV